jgi:hypothetical protein
LTGFVDGRSLTWAEPSLPEPSDAPPPSVPDPSFDERLASACCEVQCRSSFPVVTVFAAGVSLGELPGPSPELE